MFQSYISVTQWVNLTVLKHDSLKEFNATNIEYIITLKNDQSSVRLTPNKPTH